MHSYTIFNAVILSTLTFAITSSGPSYSIPTLPCQYIFPHLSESGALFSLFAALSVQQPSLLGASPSVYSQQSALAAASLSNQSAANYQLSQQTAALQQQAAAAAAAALQQVSHSKGSYSAIFTSCLVTCNTVLHCNQTPSLPCSL